MIRRACITLIMLALVTPACGSPGGVRVTMDEYSVEADPRSERTGPVTFRVRNVGSIAHQLLVLATPRDAERLPVRGGLVRLRAEGIETAGEIELLAGGASEELEVSLDPGPYVLICNIAGHYDLGMRTSFRVGA